MDRDVERRSLNGLNTALGVIGLVGVALRTHDLLAVVLAFVAALHFTVPLPAPVPSQNDGEGAK